MRQSSSSGGLPRRRAFTLAETVIAVGILGAVLLLLAQLGCEFVRQRQQSASRQVALEAAANALEAARACPWEELTSAWAARQQLPASLAEQLPQGRLEVKVEPEPGRPHTRRVTAEVRWSPDDSKPARRVQLVSLRSARVAAATGEQP